MSSSTEVNQALALAISVQNEKNTASILKTQSHWHKLILNVLLTIVCEILQLIIACKNRFKDFIEFYDNAIAFTKKHPMSSLQSMPTEAESGLVIALCSQYPWVNNAVMGVNALGFPMAVGYAATSTKYGPCMRSKSGGADGDYVLGALYIATMWGTTFEGAGVGDTPGPLDVQKIICDTFSKCKDATGKDSCIPSCRPMNISSEFDSVGLPAIQNGVNTGISGGFLAGPEGALAGAALGAALGAWQGSENRNTEQQNCMYNAKYSNCYMPP